MDIESKKIKSPYSPSEDYFVDLAKRIQQRVGIEVLDVVNREKEVPFNEKQKPLQLTVEFGYPLKAEKQPKVYESPLEIVQDEISEPIVAKNLEETIAIETAPIEHLEQEVLQEVPELNETTFIPQEEEKKEELLPVEAEIVEVDVTEVESVENPAEIVMETEDLKIEIAPIHMEMELVHYNEAELDALHEVLSAELNGTGATMNTVPTFTPKVEETVNEVQQNFEHVEMAVEPNFTDAELDALHEKHEKEINAQRLAQEQILNATKLEGQTQHVELNKTGIWQMIPWSTVFGMVASLMAVASAWLIWNSIQKPLPIDEYIDKTMVTKASPSAVPAITENNSQGVDISTLSISDQVVYSDVVEEELPQPKNYDFKKLSEQSKISSVELERVGLTVLDLEDELFDDIEI